MLSPEHDCYLGAVTVRLTVGPAPFVPVLLDTTPSESTPTIVNVYVLAGVVPLGVVVETLLLVLPHAGSRSSDPLTTNKASSPHAFRERFPPAATPRQMKPTIGRGNHSA